MVLDMVLDTAALTQDTVLDTQFRKPGTEALTTQQAGIAPELDTEQRTAALDMAEQLKAVHHIVQRHVDPDIHLDIKAAAIQVTRHTPHTPPTAMVLAKKDRQFCHSQLPLLQRNQTFLLCICKF